MGDTNLIPMHRRVARKKRVRTQCWIGTWISYSAVLVAGTLAIRAATSGDESALAVRLDVKTGAINIATQALSQVEKELQEAAQQLVTSKAIGNQPDWSILLMLLSAQLPDAMSLERCDLKPQKRPVPVVTTTKRGPAKPTLAAKPAAKTPPGYVLTLSGQAATQSDVSQFVLGLEGAALFDKVTLVETRNQPNPMGETVGFRVECLLEAEGGGA